MKVLEKISAYDKGARQGKLDQARKGVNRESYYGDYYSNEEYTRQYSSGYRTGWHGFPPATIQTWYE